MQMTNQLLRMLSPLLLSTIDDLIFYMIRGLIHFYLFTVAIFSSDLAALNDVGPISQVIFSHMWNLINFHSTFHILMPHNMIIFHFCIISQIVFICYIVHQYSHFT